MKGACNSPSCWRLPGRRCAHHRLRGEGAGIGGGREGLARLPPLSEERATHMAFALQTWHTKRSCRYCKLQILDGSLYAPSRSACIAVRSGPRRGHVAALPYMISWPSRLAATCNQPARNRARIPPHAPCMHAHPRQCSTIRIESNNANSYNTIRYAAWATEYDQDTLQSSRQPQAPPCHSSMTSSYDSPRHGTAPSLKSTASMRAFSRKLLCMNTSLSARAGVSRLRRGLWIKPLVVGDQARSHAQAEAGWPASALPAATSPR